MIYSVNVKNHEEFEDLVYNKDLNISKVIVDKIFDNLETTKRFIYVLKITIEEGDRIIDLTIDRNDFIDTLEKRALVVGLSKEGWKTSRTMLKERQQLRDTIGMLINKNPDFQILAERVLLPLFQERTDFLEDLQYDYDTLNEYGVYLPNLPGTEDI